MNENHIEESYRQYKRHLNDIYRPVFERIEAYVTTQNIDLKIHEERMSELLDIFLNAQSEEKPVRDIIGNDIDRFCKNFCSDFTLKNRIASIIDGLKILMLMPTVSTIFNIGSWIATEEAKTDNYNFFHCMSWGNIMTYLIISFSMLTILLITNIVLRRIMFKMKRLSSKAVAVVQLIEIAIITAIIIGLRLYEISISIPTWIIVFALIIYYVLYYLLCVRNKRHIKIKLSKNEKK